MAKYTTAEFDLFAFKWFCKDLFDEALLESIKIGISGAKYWDSEHGGYIEHDVNNIYQTGYTIGTINAKAFIQEYGSGLSIDDSSNPDYPDYRHGDYWNPARKDKTIVGRPAGTYILPNWKTGMYTEKYTSKGKMEGRPIPFAIGQLPIPKIDMMLLKIYSLFLIRINDYVIPSVQKAIDRCQFIKMKTNFC